MKARIALCSLALVLATQAAENKLTPISPIDQKEKTEKTEKAESSVSKSQSTSTSRSVINGKSVTITRTTGDDGKETVTITTIERNGKPKEEQMTGEEFNQKYCKKKKPRGGTPAASTTPTKPGKATE